MEKAVLAVLDHIASLYPNKDQTGIDHRLVERNLAYVLAGLKEIKQHTEQLETNVHVIKENLK